MNRVKAVIFDMDNTLLDFWKFKRAATRAAVDAMAREGLKTSKTRAMKMMFDIYREKGFEYGEVFEEFMKRTRGKVDYRIVAPAIVAYREARAHVLHSYPDAAAVLKELKKRGYILMLVTDAPRLKAWLRLAMVGLHRAFDDVITRDEKGAGKKTGLPFRKALKKLRLKPSQVMVVGDSWSRDMVPAQKLGMQTCLAMYGRARPAAGKADYELKSLKDLLRICG
jgi:putative hydrolase of the HAD superfamily